MTVNKKLAIPFFYSREKLEKASMIWERWGIDSSAPDPVYETWGGLNCEFSLVETQVHYILFVQIWQSSFLEQLLEFEDKNEDVRQMPLIQAFIQKALATKPEAAYVATHLDQSSIDHALKLEEAILSRDAAFLARERLGLLYLNEEIGHLLEPDPLRDYPIQDMQGGPQRLVFADQGKDPLF